MWDPVPSLLPWSVVVLATLVAACTDLTSRRIPNMLTGPVLLLGLVHALWMGGVSELSDALMGCALLTLPYALLFVFAHGGAGDAKMMGAIGAWLGVANGTVVLVSVMLSGVVLGLGLVVVRRRLGSVLANLSTIISSLLLALARGRMSEGRTLLPVGQQMETMPYGIAIFAGTCIAAGGTFVWHP